MTITSLLVKNIAEMCSLSSIMNGGKMNNSINNLQKGKNTLFIILILLLILLIKGFIVYMLYNYMMPKLLYSLSENKSYEKVESNFKPISFSESVLLVIFFNVLFTS